MDFNTANQSRKKKMKRYVCKLILENLFVPILKLGMNGLSWIMKGQRRENETHAIYLYSWCNGYHKPFLVKSKTETLGSHEKKSRVFSNKWDRDMLVYSSGKGYIDLDLQGNRENRKSLLGSTFTWEGGAIVLRSVKQGYNAYSTMKAENMTACEAAKQGVLFHWFLMDLEVVHNLETTLTLFSDNNEV